MIRAPYIGQRVRLRYGKRYRIGGASWQDVDGTVVAIGRGPGPHNVAVRTKAGCVVVPRGNLMAWEPARQGRLF